MMAFNVETKTGPAEKNETGTWLIIMHCVFYHKTVKRKI